MGDDQLNELEASLPQLKATYFQVMEAYLKLCEGRSKKEDRLPVFRKWQDAATAFFNAHDKVVAVGALCGADKNATWFTDRAETATNVLETILNHYEVTAAKAAHEGITAPQPSLTAFANLQRIVKAHTPDVARQFRDSFVKANLPTRGFDIDETEKSPTRLIEPRFFAVGVVMLVLAIGLAISAFVIGDLTPDQRLILRWSLPLASGFAAGGFAGSLTTGSKSVGYGLAVAATGGFAVWLLSFWFF